MMSGLTSTMGFSPTSTTITRLRTPTCGAASPTPDAAYIVSSMSRARRRTRRLILGTDRALLDRIGSGIATIFSAATSARRQPVQALHRLVQLAL